LLVFNDGFLSSVLGADGKYLLANGHSLTILICIPSKPPSPENRIAPNRAAFFAYLHMPDTDVVILKALLEAGSNFVSGNNLATELGISRVGVWARLENLREDGFIVEAIRHRGYRLTTEPSVLNEPLVRAYLELGGVKVGMIFRTEVDSTNTEAERQLAAGAQTPFAVLARRQTSGRGRLGRNWHSVDEGSLYMSMGFRPQLPPAQMQMITLWMGVQICRYINDRLGLPAQVKWPNDIVSGTHKLCGILAEARVDADHTRDLVFGIGINVNSQCDKWPQETASVATSLALLGGHPLKINLVASEMIEVVSRAYDRYVSARLYAAPGGMRKSSASPVASTNPATFCSRWRTDGRCRFMQARFRSARKSFNSLPRTREGAGVTRSGTWLPIYTTTLLLTPHTLL
jgi:BirA family biotin operon repressor/biotin-[acetyl-CoA-carboxylase] ligase